SASAKVICFMGKLGEVKSGDFAKSGSLFQTFPKGAFFVPTENPKPRTPHGVPGLFCARPPNWGTRAG
ncbi:hypothetical protein, partial [Pseudomonas aeruginosa]|uniref:hypothetical protein n=1 Tax=Pseudomonas aeruginosa TaxID=287 RepID=UPI001E5CFDE4